MNERLMELRKREKLSRAAFGERIGVSGDVINNLERGRVELKESMIKLIAQTFEISEEWLRSGNGEMYDGGGDAVHRLAEEYKLTPFQEALIRGVVEMDEKQREALWGAFNKYLSPIMEAAKESEDEEKKRRERLHEELDRELDDEKKAGGRSAAS